MIAMVLPREHHKVEQTNVVSNLSDEELAAIVEYLQQRIARQAKLIEGKAVETTALPAPVDALKPRRPNKRMDTADTAIGPLES